MPDAGRILIFYVSQFRLVINKIIDLKHLKKK